MDISELKGRVLQRFQELTDDEQMIAQTLKDSPVGEVILKLIGPELRQVFSEPEDETEKMLAEDKDIPDLAKDMPEEFRERPSMPSAGPNPEQYRVDPTRPEFKRPRPEETDIMMKREMASR